MTRRYPLIVLITFFALALAVTGCKKQTPTTVAQTPPEPADERTVVQPPPAVEDTPRTEVTEGFQQEDVETGDADLSMADIDRLNREEVLKTIYFPYDSHDLGDEARLILQENARWLGANPDRYIRIEGHCDERGTIEYNLALGERRASSVRDYLVSLGVDAFRIRIVSYGEEDPVDTGHDESAWAKNRRADFMVES